MRYLIAVLLPPLAFFTMGMPLSGLFCLLLQVTLIGWLPAAVWACFAVSHFHTVHRENAYLRQYGQNAFARYVRR